MRHRPRRNLLRRTSFLRLLPRELRLTRGIPPLVPGLPVFWVPTLVVSQLVQVLRWTGVCPNSRAIPRGLLDDLVAPWGCVRYGRAERTARRLFFAPCDCGRLVRWLVLKPDARWACDPCLGVPRKTGLRSDAAQLLFALRLGFQGMHPTLLHLRLVNRIREDLPSLSRADRLALITAATVVASFECRVSGRWTPAGPLARSLGPAYVDAYLHDWASPVAYASRCGRELGLLP